MRQAPSGQRINTDSCSFAALIGSGLSPNRILDVGAGTGVVALMLAKRFANAEIVAVEPELSTLDIAKENFEKSPWAQRISFLGQMAQDLDPAFIGYFDFVACNPPYFHQSMLSSDPLRQMARHTKSLHPLELYQSFARLLTQDGTAWLSCPSSSQGDWIAWGKQAGLQVFTEIQIHDHPGAPAHVTIFGWKRVQGSLTEVEHVYYRMGPGGDQSEWMRLFRDTWYPKRFNR